MRRGVLEFWGTCSVVLLQQQKKNNLVRQSVYQKRVRQQRVFLDLQPPPDLATAGTWEEGRRGSWAAEGRRGSWAAAHCSAGVRHAGARAEAAQGEGRRGRGAGDWRRERGQLGEIARLPGTRVLGRFRRIGSSVVPRIPWEAAIDRIEK